MGHDINYKSPYTKYTKNQELININTVIRLKASEKGGWERRYKEIRIERTRNYH